MFAGATLARIRGVCNCGRDIVQSVDVQRCWKRFMQICSRNGDGRKRINEKNHVSSNEYLTVIIKDRT